ncbi:MAG: hypothetical protein MUC97_05490 [Bernardetiaceae bacterium]|jgi:hypothetical protein|nr:hypothetical protein [Bernardetiaceae bacterium]
MKKLLCWALSLGSLALVSCIKIEFNDSAMNNTTLAPVEAQLGTIVAQLNGVRFVFASDGGLPDRDTNGYDAQFRLLSLYRQVSAVDQRRLQIQLINVDVDALRPPVDIPAESVRIRYFAGGSNQRFEATGADVRLSIVSKQGDVLRGAFTGNLRDAQGGQMINLQNGGFHLTVRRF